MLAIERRQEIMKTIKRERSVIVSELAERFMVTEETIRRDLDKLDKEGKVKKTYGGAVIENPVSEDPSFMDRQKVNIEEKKIIGAAAAQLIKDGETIFIDMSTTALEVIKAVNPGKHITVITNSLEAIIVLGKMDNINLITIGGTFDKGYKSMWGAVALKQIEQYYVDKTFFSVKAISKDRGIMDSKDEIVMIKSSMVHNSRETILLMDKSKFDTTALCNRINIDEVDTIVTEYELDASWSQVLKKHQIEVVLAKKVAP